MTSDDANPASGAADAAAPRPKAYAIIDMLMRFELRIARIEDFVAITALAVAAIAVGVSAAIRAFDLPVPDTGEWAIVAMSPLTFVGAALCSHLHRHLTADTIEAVPHGRLRRALEGLVAMLFITFGVYFVALSNNLFTYAVDSGEKLIDLGTPVAVPVGFMLAGAVLMTFHATLDLIRAIAGYAPGGTNPWP